MRTARWHLTTDEARERFGAAGDSGRAVCRVRQGAG